MGRSRVEFPNTPLFLAIEAKRDPGFHVDDATTKIA
jgi:hypothetical protein